MPRLDIKTVSEYSLKMSKQEAEILHAYLENCLAYGAEFDPEYESWDWSKTAKVLRGIKDLLPEAL